MLTLAPPPPLSWLKSGPAEPPPRPPHADLHVINIQAVELQARWITAGPAVAYIRENGPAAQTDRWGGALPLSLPEQARLDRMVAVLSNPGDRGLALVLSGTLDPGEADAIRSVYPEIYAELVRRAKLDMATTPPPYTIWAEQTLTVLFGQPLAKVYSDQVAPHPAAGPSKPGAKDESSNPTPADRREIAVRQKGQG